MKEAIGSGVRNCPNPCFRSVPLARDSLELGDSKPQIRDESNACIAGKSINSRAIQASLALMDRRVNFLSIHRRGGAPNRFCVGRPALARLGIVRSFVELEKFEIFYDAFLEAKEIAAAGVGLGGRGLAEEPAEVIEMLLIGRGFLAGIAGPFLFELGSRHGGESERESKVWSEVLMRSAR